MLVLLNFYDTRNASMLQKCWENKQLSHFCWIYINKHTKNLTACAFVVFCAQRSASLDNDVSYLFFIRSRIFPKLQPNFAMLLFCFDKYESSIDLVTVEVYYSGIEFYYIFASLHFSSHYLLIIWLMKFLFAGTFFWRK